MSVEIAKGNDGRETVQNSVDAHFADEKVFDYKCPGLQCNGRSREVTKGLRLSNSPDILTIQLKLFDSDYRHEKLAVEVCDIDHDLVVCDGTKYTCFGVVCHIGGSRRSGHYNAFVLRDGSWYRMDEKEGPSKLSPSVDTAEVRRNAYILFYSKVPQDQHSALR
jgi:ubiquitin C-terminal hydrolase